MGELEPWIDENFVRSVWYNMGEQVNVKMIRDKFSGYGNPQPGLLDFYQCVLIIVVTLAIALLILRILPPPPKHWL